MKFDPKQLLLYGVTYSAGEMPLPLEDQVELALLGGATMIQYREKKLSGEALKKQAVSLLKICRNHKVPFILNDYPELAKEIGADGVHVGQADTEAKKAREIIGPDMILGVTAKTPEQVKAAVEAGADYLGSGAVFGSATKTDAKPMDMETFKHICEISPLPVVAIGGISADNLLQLSGSGAAGAAVVSGLFDGFDIEINALYLLSLIEKAGLGFTK